MKLTNALLTDFAAAVISPPDASGVQTTRGSIISIDSEDGKDVTLLIDGSPAEVKATTMVECEANDRVMIMIKNHNATVIGNISHPVLRKVTANKIDATEILAILMKVDTVQSQDRNSWINFKLGMFNFGNRLVWNGSILDIGPWHVSNQAIYKGSQDWGSSETNAAYLGNSGISITDKFKVDSTGALSSIKGTIGGWTIDSARLFTTNPQGNYVSIGNGTNNNQDVFVVRTGSEGSYVYPFYVRATGFVHASNLDVTGGTIGGWNIKTHVFEHTSPLTDGRYYRTQLRDYNYNSNHIAFAVQSGTMPDLSTGLTDYIIAKYNGEFKATKAIIKGDVTADTGKIGPWTINEYGIVGDNDNIFIHSDGHISAQVSQSGTVYYNVFAPGMLNISSTSSSVTKYVNINQNGIEGGHSGNPSFKAFQFNAADGTGSIGNWEFTSAGRLHTSASQRTTTIDSGYMGVHTVDSASSPTSGTGYYVADDETGVQCRFIINRSGGTHGLYSNGYSDGINYTSNNTWVICRDTKGDTHLQAGKTYAKGWAGNERVVAVSNSTDGNRMEGLICKSATQAGIYGQWGVTGSTYKYMYWSVSSSDPRLKYNIQPVDIQALPLINRLPMHSFTWLTSNKHWDFGFLAPELYSIDPNLTIEPDNEEEGYWGIDNFYLTGVLVKAVQELSEKVETLERKLENYPG